MWLQLAHYFSKSYVHQTQIDPGRASRAVSVHSVSLFCSFVDGAAVYVLREASGPFCSHKIARMFNVSLVIVNETKRRQNNHWRRTLLFIVATVVLWLWVSIWCYCRPDNEHQLIASCFRWFGIFVCKSVGIYACLVAHMYVVDTIWWTCLAGCTLISHSR